MNKILDKSFKKALFALASITIMTGCGSKNTTPSLSQAKISEDTKFGSANVDISIDSFNKLGFNLGDSCDIKFSNGYQLLDVPYFNGYYVKNGDPVIVAYPSNENILITLNNTGIWNTANLTSDCTVDITLNTAYKYKDTQEALGQSYSLDRTEYSSDEEFCNFRSLSGGKLKDSLIYRGASPVDNSRNRAKYTDTLLEKTGIKTIIDLADTKEDMEIYFIGEAYSSEYTKSLYDAGDICLLGMGSSYGSESYMKSVATGFKFMLEHDGPYYIHCMEGKDRTGFVCMLVEALCGATYDEMCSDYMVTYKNYYKITSDKTPEKYQAVVNLYFDSFMQFLHNSSTGLKNADYTNDAKQYLKDGGMTDDEINSLIDKLTK